MPRLAVADVLASDTSPSSLGVEVAATTTFGELRALLLSLPTPSAQPGLRVCHDGRLIEADEEVTLLQLGVLECPVVVIAGPPVPKSSRWLPSFAAQRPASAAATAAPAASTAAAAAAAASTPPPTSEAATGHTPDVGPPRASTPPDEDRGPPPDAMCRICFGSAYENGAGRLISPCLCSGSMRYVHVACLNEWRVASANPRSFFQCEQCNYQYNVERTRWASILESDRVVRSLAAALLVAAIVLAAIILAPLGAAHRFFALIHFSPRDPYFVGTTAAGLWTEYGWQLDALCSGLLGVALAGFASAVHDAWAAHRHMTHTWMAGLVTAIATNDERIFRVFALGGGVVALQQALHFAQSLSKKWLTKWGTMICEVRR